MEQKVFNIFKADEVSKIQIGADVISLDEEERKRILRLFKTIKDSKVLFPDGLQGACLIYSDGLIAANISLSKINLSGTRYLLFVYHKTPKSEEFDANTFLLDGDLINKYIESLE